MTQSTSTFSTPPPPTSFTRLSFPTPHTLLVTLSRPKSLNCINTAGHVELDVIWTWFDNEPSLRVGIITGEGRAFCAGADLKEWNLQNSSTSPTPRSVSLPSGFAGLSTRTGKKPIISAVNGICFGGGFEAALNTDLILASSRATFSLPEVLRGVAAIAGALPRLARTVGKQRAMELALTGRVLGAREAREWGVVNMVVEDDDDVVGEAVRWARVIGEEASPDSVVVSREGVRRGWEGGEGVGSVGVGLREGLWRRVDGGENMKEGVRAFVEKRKPRWRDSKL